VLKINIPLVTAYIIILLSVIMLIGTDLALRQARWKLCH